MESTELQSEIEDRNNKIQALIKMIITSENDVPLNTLIRQIEEITIYKLQLKEAKDREDFDKFYAENVK